MSLKKVVLKIAKKVKETEEKNPTPKISEEHTGKVFVDPIIESLGWDISNFDEVLVNYSLKDLLRNLHRKKKDKISIPELRVDYIFRLENRPVLIWEIKKFNEALENHIDQLIDYCKTADVRWGCLTNGKNFILFDSFERNSRERSMLEISIDSTALQAERLNYVVEVLSIFSKENFLEGNVEVKFKYNLKEEKKEREFRKYLKEKIFELLFSEEILTTIVSTLKNKEVTFGLNETKMKRVVKELIKERIFPKDKRVSKKKKIPRKDRRKWNYSDIEEYIEDIKESGKLTFYFLKALYRNNFEATPKALVEDMRKMTGDKTITNSIFPGIMRGIKYHQELHGLENLVEKKRKYKEDKYVIIERYRELIKKYFNLYS